MHDELLKKYVTDKVFNSALADHVDQFATLFSESEMTDFREQLEIVVVRKNRVAYGLINDLPAYPNDEAKTHGYYSYGNYIGSYGEILVACFHFTEIAGPAADVARVSGGPPTDERDSTITALSIAGMTLDRRCNRAIAQMNRTENGIIRIGGFDVRAYEASGAPASDKHFPMLNAFLSGYEDGYGL